MTEARIDRSLWYKTVDEQITVDQQELLKRSEPLIVLGEAGMGKSHLLGWLAKHPGYKYCTARALINRKNPTSLLSDAAVLVIDALDEVSTQRDGDAVDLVLSQLGVLGYPRFVLSCRVADWRSATGTSAIREQYDLKPLELHLVPFDDQDAVNFLAPRLGQPAAETTVAHFNRLGLNGMLGNPQTLEMILRVAVDGSLPDTKGELFERAIEVLRVEHRPGFPERVVARDAGLDASGAAFGGLILTGHEAVVRTAEAEQSAEDLQLVEITTLPGGQAVASMVGTRLFRANGVDRFTYWHRRIGEFVGARWLSRHADTTRKRRRLLNAFHGHGLVPANLRGIHAWLARDPSLAQSVITFDPMGVVEYGDTDNLTAEQARWLLGALKDLADQNPRFTGWEAYSIQSLARPELIGDLRGIVASPQNGHALHTLILRSIKGTPLASQLESQLLTLALTTSNYYLSRLRAAEALIGVRSVAEWSSILSGLGQEKDGSSIRLAIDLAPSIGFEAYSDTLISDLVIAHSCIRGRVSGILWRLERLLPAARIDGILDQFSAAAARLKTNSGTNGSNDRTDFAFYLIARRLAEGKLNARRLWSWLQPFDASMGYQTEPRAKVEVHVKNDPNLRRELQKHALLNEDTGLSLRETCYRMTRSLQSLFPFSDDVVALLEHLDPANSDDNRWREIIQIVRHDGPFGREVRDAARRFAKDDVALLQWIDDLAIQKIADWEVKDANRKQERRENDLANRLHDREHYGKNLAEMRAGDWRHLVNPAKAYLNMYSDLGQDLEPVQQIAAWLGPEIAAAACTGFEAFLSLSPAEPDADQLARSFAEGQSWNAEYIIVAGVAELLRTGKGFDDLANERLIAALFVLLRTRIDAHAQINGLMQAIKLTVRNRGIFEEAMRRYLEPQFEMNLERIDGLGQFIQSEEDASVAPQLAFEWLQRFPDMPAEPELELISSLVRSGHWDNLRVILSEHLAVVDLERARTWLAVGLIVAFDEAKARIEASAIDRELIWHIRRFTGGRHGDGATYAFGPRQVQWIISSFRNLWPRTSSPVGGWSGTSNPWDASNYITELIARLGRDSSEEAVSALQALRDAPADSYTETLRSISSEQAQIRVEATYVPLTMGAVKVILEDAPPISIVDLQFFMAEELAIVQNKIESDDAESWRGFFDDNGVAYEEERCRDHLLGLLRQGSHGVSLTPEVHLGGDKEADIACSVGPLRIPIEIKGQWHSELWHNADTQLDQLYAVDWRAEKHGIYVVLWFGDGQPKNKQLSSPGRGVQRPRTPEDLRDMLAKRSQGTADGRISIFVLDLTH